MARTGSSPLDEVLGADTAFRRSSGLDPVAKKTTGTAHHLPPAQSTPRDKFVAEGVKNDGGKLRYDLIPVRPLERVAEVYTIGAKKYDDNNWRKGLKWGRVFAAMLRHAWAWWRGETRDPVDGQHHLASVAWCALTLMEYEETHPELDDRADKR